jgi:hypothetical protein
MTDIKFLELGGFTINVNAITYVQAKGGTLDVHFIGGQFITISSDMSTFLLAAKRAK